MSSMSWSKFAARYKRILSRERKKEENDGALSEEAVDHIEVKTKSTIRQKMSGESCVIDLLGMLLCYISN